MWEDFLYSIQGFKRNKTRTFLSLLGVIIGVASVIIITSIGSSTTKEVKNTFGTSGLDIVTVSQGGFMRRNRSVSLSFDDSFRDDLFDNVKNIEKVWYKNSLSLTATYGDLSSTLRCAAIEPGYLEMYNLELESGSFFTVTDNEEGTQKIILNHDTAETYFPAGDAVGKKILLVSNKVTFGFEIIGVLKEQSTGMETSSAFVPRGFYAKKIKPNPESDSALVQCISVDKATEVVSSIKDYYEKKTGIEGAVTVTSMQSMMEQMSKITNTLSVLLSAIAAISLLVGGIGIMNIMIVTVTERKQEIGIRKALGASPSDIRQQFLVESASITLVGGTFGVIIGSLLSIAVEYVMSQAYTVNVNACIISFVFSVFVGVFFGLNPASRAAKLDPVIALSGE